MVVEFVRKLKLQKSQYIFAVATCGGTPAGALGRLRNILYKNGVNINSGFLIQEDLRLEGDNRPSVINLWNISGIKPFQLKERLSEIIDVIKNKKNHKLEMSS